MVVTVMRHQTLLPNNSNKRLWNEIRESETQLGESPLWDTLSLQYEHFGQLVHTSYAAIYCKGIEMIDICCRMFAL